MRKFRRLAASGIAGLAIVSAPVALTTTGVASAATVSASSVTTHVTDAATRWPVVRRGARGERVAVIQYLLRARGYRVPAIGRFGPATEKAVRHFQRVRGLRPDGVVGPATWARLVITVRKGSRGDAVRALQHSLRFAYGYRIKIDGFFGNATRDAVRKFQGRFGLFRDGVAGSVTWRVLVANER